MGDRKADIDPIDASIDRARAEMPPFASWLRGHAARLALSGCVVFYGLRIGDLLVVLLGLGFLVRPVVSGLASPVAPSWLSRLARGIAPVGRIVFVALCVLVILRELSKIPSEGNAP